MRELFRISLVLENKYLHTMLRFLPTIRAMDVHTEPVIEPDVEAPTLKLTAKKKKVAKKARAAKTGKISTNEGTQGARVLAALQKRDGKTVSIDELVRSLRTVPRGSMMTVLSKLCTEKLARRIDKGIYASTKKASPAKHQNGSAKTPHVKNPNLKGPGPSERTVFILNLIKSKGEEGVSKGDIVQAMNETGYDGNARTVENTIYRHRRALTKNGDNYVHKPTEGASAQ